MRTAASSTSTVRRFTSAITPPARQRVRTRRLLLHLHLLLNRLRFRHPLSNQRRPPHLLPRLNLLSLRLQRPHRLPQASASQASRTCRLLTTSVSFTFRWTACGP